MLAMAQIELYSGDAEVAFKHVMGQRKALKESLLLRTQLLRIDSLYLQARTALACAVHSSVADQTNFLMRTAERIAHRISKEKMPWSDPLVPLIRAAIAHNRGDESLTAALLRGAVLGVAHAGLQVRALTGRRRL